MAEGIEDMTTIIGQIQIVTRKINLITRISFLKMLIIEIKLMIIRLEVATNAEIKPDRMT